MIHFASSLLIEDSWQPVAEVEKPPLTAETQFGEYWILQKPDPHPLADPLGPDYFYLSLITDEGEIATLIYGLKTLGFAVFAGARKGAYYDFLQRQTNERIARRALSC